MTKLITSFLLFFFSISCYSQSSSFELRQGREAGNILLVQNNIIQDTVGKFGFQISLQDFYISDQENIKYIVIDDYYNYWLCSAIKNKNSWNIEYEQFFGVSRSFKCESLPKFKFSSSGEIQKLNIKTNSFEKYRVQKVPTVQEVINNGGYK